MVKKLKSIAAGSSDSQLGAAIKDSATQIWLAGLGAFAKAQEEGGKVFEALVKEGGVLQKRTKKITEERVSEVTNKVSKAATDFSRQANGTWDKLEQVFEDRVARALGRLGVPSKKDLDALVARVDAIAPVTKRAKATKPVTANAAPAKKVVAKKPAAKKPAVKASAPAKRATKKAPSATSSDTPPSAS
jgi:poly(hydroxyalkanoate) granule-associated protein